MDYDPNLDAYLSWQEAIAELRRRGVRQGQFPPRNDEERAIIELGDEPHA